MLGVFLNMVLFALGGIALTSGISFYIKEKENFIIRNYILLFAAAAFLVCGGYSIMSVFTDTTKAWIPRLFGLYGIELFLLLELAFLTRDLEIKKSIRGMTIGVFALLVLLDLLIFGRPGSIRYVRYAYYTAYENVKSNEHMFHYSMIFAFFLILLILAIKWYKSKVIKRDKLFTLELIASNFLLVLVTIPDVFHTHFSTKYPTFGYSAAFALVFFSWLFACRWHISFIPSVKNVCQEVYYTIDIPIFIFNIDGLLTACNPKASSVFGISENDKPGLRDLFNFTDVENLRLLKKAKDGKGGQYFTSCKKNNEACLLSLTVKYDNADEPLCLIGTVTKEKSK